VTSGRAARRERGRLIAAAAEDERRRAYQEVLARITLLEENLSRTPIGGDFHLQVPSLSIAGNVMASWVQRESAVLGIPPGYIHDLRNIPSARAHAARMSLIRPAMARGADALMVLHNAYGIPNTRPIVEVARHDPRVHINDKAHRGLAALTVAHELRMATSFAASHMFWIKQSLAAKRLELAPRSALGNRGAVLLASPAMVLFSEPIPVRHLDDLAGTSGRALELASQCDERILEDLHHRGQPGLTALERRLYGGMYLPDDPQLPPLSEENLDLIGLRFVETGDEGQFATMLLIRDRSTGKLQCPAIPDGHPLRLFARALAPSMSVHAAKHLAGEELRKQTENSDVNPLAKLTEPSKKRKANRPSPGNSAGSVLTTRNCGPYT
jgi:hypothetical protein